LISTLIGIMACMIDSSSHGKGQNMQAGFFCRLKKNSCLQNIRKKRT